MRITIAKADLVRVLSSAVKVVEARTTIPILSNVLISVSDGTFRVRATDLDLEVQSSMAVLDFVPGATTVNARLLSDVAKKAGSDVSLELDGDTLTVKSGRSRFKLQTLPVDDFPSLAAGTFDVEFDVDLAALVAPTQFAMSGDDARYYLQGVYFHTAEGRLAAVATDGHRLSRHYGDPRDHFDGVILPRKLVSILPKGNVRVSLSGTKVRIHTSNGADGDTTITSRLIDGTFPDYQRVIPTGNDKIVLADRKALATAVERVSVISSEGGRAVKMEILPGTITLSVNNPDSGSATEEVGADYSGEPIEIGFNAAYLTELLAALEGDTVRIALNDGGSPTIFTGGNENLLAVCMPMRVS